MSAAAYPLAWPQGWPRTKVRERSRFKQTLAAAMRGLETELGRINARSVVISSNVTLGQERPSDPGVALYFRQGPADRCVPCDRWDRVQDNVHAIALTLEALRGIDRWGTPGMMAAAFRGFAALPSPADGPTDWRTLLGFEPGSTPTPEEIRAAYRKRIGTVHPDRGDVSDSAMALNVARDAALRELEGGK